MFKVVELSKIKELNNYRTRLENLPSLMMSIKENGLINPVTVAVKGKSFVLVAGHRRFNACKKLGMKKIDVKVIEGDYETINLTENLHREDVSSFEIGRGIHTIMTKSKLSKSEVAAKLSLPVSLVTNYINVYKYLPKEFKEIVKNVSSGVGKRKGLIPNTLAMKVLSAKKSGVIDAAVQRDILNKIKSDDSIKMSQVTNMIKEKTATPKTGTENTFYLKQVYTVREKDLNRLLKKYKTRTGIRLKIRDIVNKGLGIDGK